MEYKPLGRTGVMVSELCFGAMLLGNYKSDEQTAIGIADKDESHRILDRALDAGINFIDTANIYGFGENGVGESERFLGEALAKDGRRKNIVLATKFFGPTGTDPNAQGLSRRHIIDACDASLKRLNTEWIDLYQLHRIASDVPIDETLRALDDLIRAGKVRYIGGSLIPGWRIMEALWVSKELGLNRLVCEQPTYNMLDRTIERELLPTAQSYGVAIIPFGPLCGGLLSGKYSREDDTADGRWQGGKDFRNRTVSDHTWDVLDALRPMAQEKGCSMSQLALAWMMAQPGVTAPIIGPRKLEQLEDNLGAIDVAWTDEDNARFDNLVPPASYSVRYYDESVSGNEHGPTTQRIML